MNKSSSSIRDKEEAEEPTTFIYSVDGQQSRSAGMPQNVTRALIVVAKMIAENENDDNDDDDESMSKSKNKNKNDDQQTTTLQESAFRNCTSLINVQFHHSLALHTIGTRAFDNCTALTSISGLPPTLTKLQDSCFAWCRSLASITLNHGLLEIGNGAFEGAGLTLMNIPNTVEIIGDRAFAGCHLMTTLCFEEEEDGRLQEIGVRAFASCAGLAQIKIPSAVERLKSGAFAWCNSLWAIHLPHGLREISDNLLERCLALEHISLPSTVETIGNRAFEYFTQLVEINLSETMIKAIGFRSFAHCSVLENICFLSTMVTIDEAAFADCRAMQDTQLPNGLQSLGGFAFSGCQSLQSVSVPSSIRGIETGTFQGCFSLTDVDLKEGLEIIGDSAFSFCDSLSAISFPRSLNMIGRAFHCCLNLLEVEIPTNAELIMTFRPPCFSQCQSLVTVSIPSSMDGSMAHAFSDCERLQLPPPPPPLQKSLEHGENGNDHNAVPNKLHDRFHELPVHKVCYHASHSTLEDMRQALDDSHGGDSTTTTTTTTSTLRETLVDAYGMTPCHIVATSSKLPLDMFELVLDRYHRNIMCVRDCHGKTMMDYLIMHRSNKAIPLIQTALQKAITGCWTNGWGLTEWKLDLLHRVESKMLPADCDIKMRREQLDEILDRLEYYREMEATSILELALWKMAMNNQQQKFHSLSSGQKQYFSLLMDRASYRLRCGLDVVLSNVMECVWNPDTREFVYWI
ncbi:unnamed protein product [Cylindrotheca closterium]|uniref:Leucine-rich repeat protein n=1 Tax=Cylindrotheca closterium TaxID=2856 RepID=A0AAD2FZQ4_9STRA|nr:unnamed protein product [Cylindrotheca closterium]